MKRALLYLLAVSAIALANLSWAEGPSQQQMNMEELTSRLHLTPEQQEKIKPFAEQRRAKLEDIHGRMSNAASRRDKFPLMKEAKQAQDEFVSKVEPLLTPEQQGEWKKMRDEAREQMKTRLRERQQNQP
ncbi:MAG: hypothetical protein ACJ8MH_01560 [Povalibacter sp.]